MQHSGRSMVVMPYRDWIETSPDLRLGTMHRVRIPKALVSAFISANSRLTRIRCIATSFMCAIIARRLFFRQR